MEKKWKNRVGASISRGCNRIYGTRLLLFAHSRPLQFLLYEREGMIWPCFASWFSCPFSGIVSGVSRLGVLSDTGQGIDVLDVLFPAWMSPKPQLHRPKHLYQTKAEMADVAPTSKTKSALKCFFVCSLVLLVLGPTDKNQGRNTKTLKAPNPWIFLNLARWDL